VTKILLTVALVALPSAANTILASFKEAPVAAYTNWNGTYGDFSSQGTPVIFSFDPATGLGPTPRPALLYWQSTIVEPPTPGTAYTSQSVIFTAMTFIESFTGNLLLQVNSAGATLTGQAGGTVANLSAANGVSNATVSFASDYLDMNSSQNWFSLDMEAIQPGINVGAGGFLESFQGTAAGSFGTSEAPEPATIGLLGTALVLLGALRRRAGKA
jgi:hypothetical protein